MIKSGELVKKRFNASNSLGLVVSVERANSGAYNVSEHTKALVNLREPIYYVLFDNFKLEGPFRNCDLINV